MTVDEKITFAPTSFLASCASGSSDITTSALTTDIVAAGIATLDTVTLTESGETELTAAPPPGTATTSAAASLSGTVTVTETTGGPIVPVVIPSVDERV